jgi:hypothetical protein
MIGTRWLQLIDTKDSTSCRASTRALGATALTIGDVQRARQEVVPHGRH